MTCSTTTQPQKVLQILIITLAVQNAVESSGSVISITSNATAISSSSHSSCQNNTVVFTCTAFNVSTICWNITDGSVQNIDAGVCGSISFFTKFEFDETKYWPSKEDSIFNANLILNDNSTYTMSTLTYQSNGNSSFYTMKCSINSNTSDSYDVVIFNISECNDGCLTSQCGPAAANPTNNGTSTTIVAVVTVLPISIVVMVAVVVVIAAAVCSKKRGWNCKGSHRNVSIEMSSTSPASQQVNSQNNEPVQITSQPKNTVLYSSSDEPSTASTEVVFQCSPQQQVEVEWYKDDKPLSDEKFQKPDSNGRMRKSWLLSPFNRDAGCYQIVIKPVEADGGEFETCKVSCSFVITSKVPLPTPSVELVPGKATATSAVLKWELSSPLDAESHLTAVVDEDENEDENKLTNNRKIGVETTTAQSSGVVTLTELVPGVEYSIKLAASDDDRENTSEPIKFKTPAIPAGTAVSDITYNSVKIQWSTSNLEATDSVVVRNQYIDGDMVDEDEHKVPGTVGSVPLKVSPATAYRVYLTVQNKYGYADADPIDFITPVQVIQPSSTDMSEIKLRPGEKTKIAVKFKHFKQNVDVIWFKVMNGKTFEQIDKRCFYHNDQSREAVEQEATLLIECPRNMPPGSILMYKVEITPLFPSGVKTLFFTKKTKTERCFAIEIVSGRSSFFDSFSRSLRN